MDLLHGIDGLRQLPPSAVLSIGNFDGVHRGHQRLLQFMRQLRDHPGDGAVALVTFEPHPLTVLRPKLAPPRLTPVPTKDALLAHAGADVLVVLPPTPQVLGLTAEAFWQILRDDVRPAHIVEGPSFAFGKSRGGTVQRLRDWSAGTAIQVHVVQPLAVPLLNMNLAPVSSSLIRWLLAYGRARDAAICLGRPYAIEGQVVPGHQRGRTIGMPTVNLRCDDQLIPADGVYAGRCTVDGRTWPAAISIGTMPTFGSNARQLEAHLIGFSGDLYGRTLQLELLDWLRDQWKYPTVAALKSQLSRDLTATSSRANLDPSHPIAIPSLFPA